MKKAASNKKPIDTAGMMEHLPAVLTKITPQARNASRASLFLGDAFFYGCTYASLKQLGIKQGDRLSKGTFEELIRVENAQTFNDFCVRMLARREHSVYELKQKAMQRKMDLSSFDSVISNLIEKGYVDEHRFVQQFIRDKKEFRKWGSVKIKAELKKKGISDGLITECMPVAESHEIRQDMIAIIQKNRRRFNRELDILKRRKKIFDHLLRKGFPSEHILKQLDEFVKLTSDDKITKRY